MKKTTSSAIISRPKKMLKYEQLAFVSTCLLVQTMNMYKKFWKEK